MAKPIDYTTIFHGDEAKEFINLIKSPPENRNRDKTLARARELKIDFAKL